MSVARGSPPHKRRNTLQAIFLVAMRRPARVLLSLLPVIGAGLTLLPGCGVRYVATSAYYEAELLLSRKPAAKVLKEYTLSAGEEQRLRLIPRIKDYGYKLGLAATDNYDTVAVGWNRTIWNVSACDPIAFEPVTWWFPITGRVPYLGYFTNEAAQAQADHLAAEGHDVYKRTAGAFSTLGWFRDPVLPEMLTWSEPDLAETVFHELAHATLWVPGSVPFNESFANFVGVTAAHRYLADTYGPESPVLLDTLRDERDYDRFRRLLHQLYTELDAVYRDPATSDDDKKARKAALLASLPNRIRASDIESKERYAVRATRTPWNNARLMQFKAYNSNEGTFQALLDRSGGDLSRFITTIGEITRHQRDPFAALKAAVGEK